MSADGVYLLLKPCPAFLQPCLAFLEGSDILLDSFESHRYLQQFVGEDVPAQGVPERGVALQASSMSWKLLMGVVMLISPALMYIALRAPA